MLTPDPEHLTALSARVGAMAGKPDVPVPEPDLEVESRESGLVSGH